MQDVLRAELCKIPVAVVMDAVLTKIHALEEPKLPETMTKLSRLHPGASCTINKFMVPWDRNETGELMKGHEAL